MKNTSETKKPVRRITLRSDGKPTRLSNKAGMPVNAKNFLSLTSATILFSTIGLFGKIIPFPAGVISFGRAFFAALALVIYFIVTRTGPGLPTKSFPLWKLVLPGIFLSGNWYFYFLSIKVSTVAIAVLSLFTYPLWTALIEPFVFRTRHAIGNVAGGCAVVAGVALIVDRFTFSSSTALGAGFGILSGLSFAISNILNRGLLPRYSATTLMFYQYLTASLLFLPFVFTLPSKIPQSAILELAVLGGVLTTASQLFFVSTLRHITASIASLFISLQPVYTIGMAFIFLEERPSIRTILGGGVIIISVLATTVGRISDNK